MQIHTGQESCLGGMSLNKERTELNQEPKRDTQIFRVAEYLFKNVYPKVLHQCWPRNCM